MEKTQVETIQEIMTPEEFCAYAKISQRTLYRMLCRGSIPFAMKIGGSWRFYRQDVEKYLNDSKIHAKVLNVVNCCINEIIENLETVEEKGDE